MAPFSGQNWPATPDPCAVEGATVLSLSIAIMIVTPPARALWQIMFKHAIDDFD